MATPVIMMVAIQESTTTQTQTTTTGASHDGVVSIGIEPIGRRKCCDTK